MVNLSKEEAHAELLYTKPKLEEEATVVQSTEN